MTNKAGATLLVLLILLAGWCFWPSEKWRGFFYPDKDNLSNHVETGLFDSLEECRDATTAYAEDLGIPRSRYDYECGLNCKAEDSTGGLYVCEETTK